MKGHGRSSNSPDTGPRWAPHWGPHTNPMRESRTKLVIYITLKSWMLLTVVPSRRLYKGHLQESTTLNMTYKDNNSGGISLRMFRMRTSDAVGCEFCNWLLDSSIPVRDKKNVMEETKAWAVVQDARISTQHPTYIPPYSGKSISNQSIFMDRKLTPMFLASWFQLLMWPKLTF